GLTAQEEQGLKNQNIAHGATLIGEFRNVQKKTEHVRPKLHLHEAILRRKQIRRGGGHPLHACCHAYLTCSFKPAGPPALDVHEIADNSKRSLVREQPCDNAMEKNTPRFGNDGQHKQRVRCT
ncbi:unnamed protein product, partial [Ectocarpus sp. 12 AP-2014]